MTVSPFRLLSLLPLLFGAAGAVFFLLPGLSDGTSAYAAIASVEFLLPLLGIGVLLGQLPRRTAVAGLFGLLFGCLLGFWYRETLYGLLAPVQGAASHLFLAGPIACVIIGMVLVLPPVLRPWLSLPALACAGAALAVATRLADPTLFASHYGLSAPLLQAALIFAVTLPVSTTRAPGAIIAARILGSWMLAVALLYGGAYLAARDTGLTPPSFPAVPQQVSLRGVAP
jgi:hypothetical protein